MRHNNYNQDALDNSIYHLPLGQFGHSQGSSSYNGSWDRGWRQNGSSSCCGSTRTANLEGTFPARSFRNESTKFKPYDRSMFPFDGETAQCAGGQSSYWDNQPSVRHTIAFQVALLEMQIEAATKARERAKQDEEDAYKKLEDLRRFSSLFLAGGVVPVKSKDDDFELHPNHQAFLARDSESDSGSESGDRSGITDYVEWEGNEPPKPLRYYPPIPGHKYIEFPASNDNAPLDPGDGRVLKYGASPAESVPQIPPKPRLSKVQPAFQPSHAKESRFFLNGKLKDTI